MTAPDRLSDEALRYLQQLTAAKQQAELVLSGYSQLLTVQYQIGPEDAVDLATGVITRKTPA